MIRKTNIANTIRIMRNSGQSVFSDASKKKFGTIYTPEFVVIKTVDLAWKYAPADKLDLTYCDPAAGDGNFMEYLYQKLMQETAIEDPVKRSRFILTKCLYGFEILEPMVHACKIRLILLHQATVRANGGDASDLDTLWDELHVYHGNTICLPADTEQGWYGVRQKDEGGLLPEGLRGKKFDVIVGNPPYTHLRNLENRRYAAYPKQRDLAQVFVRWALDHLMEQGVCSLNTSDTWLDAKTSDGALETRRGLICRLREVVRDNEIRQYSENDGGNVGTLLCCFGIIANREYYFNNVLVVYTDDQLMSTRFLPTQVITHSFLAQPITVYVSRLFGGGSQNKYGTKTDFWRSFVFSEFGDGEYRLVIKRRLVNTTRGNIKLIRVNDFNEVLNRDFEGEVKSAITDKDHGLWLLGYLNTRLSPDSIQQFTRTRTDRGGHIAYELSNSLWPLLQVPDFDFYKSDRPERFQAYMAWIEANMRDKDAFLAGIDEQFEKLIANA